MIDIIYIYFWRFYYFTIINNNYNNTHFNIAAMQLNLHTISKSEGLAASWNTSAINLNVSSSKTENAFLAEICWTVTFGSVLPAFKRCTLLVNVDFKELKNCKYEPLKISVDISERQLCSGTLLLEKSFRWTSIEGMMMIKGIKMAEN